MEISLGSILGVIVLVIVLSLREHIKIQQAKDEAYIEGMRDANESR